MPLFGANLYNVFGVKIKNADSELSALGKNKIKICADFDFVCLFLKSLLLFFYRSDGRSIFCFSYYSSFVIQHVFYYGINICYGLNTHFLSKALFHFLKCFCIVIE